MIGINVNGLRGPAVARTEAAPALPFPPETSVARSAPVASEKEASGSESTDKSAISERVREALNAAGESLSANSKLVIRVDREANRYVYEFRDPGTGEIRGQYPDKEVLAALAASRQSLAGVAIDEKA
jgi:uncharacterized FlaG/YvyC family protein